MSGTATRGGRGMNFGVYIVRAHGRLALTDLAREVEHRGFESLFVCEHTHIPAGTTLDYPAARNSETELPEEYYGTLDPFVALAAAAAVTSRLRVGTGVCLVPQHHPITLAKTVASLDQLSGGRVLLGVGAGWNQGEMRNHGVDPARRALALDEGLAAMQAIWAQQEASYHGQLHSFDRIISLPKPVQAPHPPILVGGNGAAARARTVRLGDEWMPSDPRDNALLRKQIADLRERAAAAGRPRPRVTLFAARPDYDDAREQAEAGVDRWVYWLPSADREVVMPRLDRYADLMGRLSR
ncbi:LLM class F420-dependent oxidoreductase [Dactylosporangium sp. NPDC051485]|uniref:LLM class F420-dependent oxidoreductase n=1 Tax=Dactylosporangium sp. NPDC051485 TaxID=3154846 RepID=UPI003439EE37